MTADYGLVEHDVLHEVVLVPLPEAQACVARPHVRKAGFTADSTRRLPRTS